MTERKADQTMVHTVLNTAIHSDFGADIRTADTTQNSEFLLRKKARVPRGFSQ